MKKPIIDKIVLKLIGLIAVAFLASIGVFITLSNVYTNYIIEKSGELTGEKLIVTYNIYTLTIILVPIIVFLIIFLFGIKRRLKYIKYITKSVENIKDETYLKELKLEGSDEITSLAKSINIMSSRLRENYNREKKIEDEKNDLILALSHDLKTPLTSIIGYLDLLNKEEYNLNETQREYLDISYKKSIRLKKLIDELFEFTKITCENSPLNIREFNISVLVNQIVGEHIPFFNERGIKVNINNIGENIICKIDVEKMARAIENIVKNAEKYSYPDTEFNVCIIEEEKRIKLIFENIGDSIVEDDLHKIFQKMHRLDKARNSEKGGSGLGLSIVREIINKQGGEVLAKCNGNKISFNIYLNKN